MSALDGFWARAQAWLRHAISALAADARAHAARTRFADAALLVEAPHSASLSLRAAFDASLWVSITARSAHGRVRRLNGSPWVAVIRPAALAPTRNPDPREAFGGFASGPRPAGAHDSTRSKLRRPGFAHVECKIYICTYEAASRRRPHKSSCPCRGARRLPRDPVAWVRLRRFRLCVSAKPKVLRFNLARPSVCRYRGSSCGRGVPCGAGHP